MLPATSPSRFTVALTHERFLDCAFAYIRYQSTTSTTAQSLHGTRERSLVPQTVQESGSHCPTHPSAPKTPWTEVAAGN